MTDSLKNEHVVVIGLGRSGRSAARVLLAHGARVTANDKRARASLDGQGELAALEGQGADIVCGEHPPELLASADRIVVSPGVPALPALARAEAAGVPIVGEVDLAARFIEAPILGITGTNGKSTVTSLVGEMCQRTGRPTFVGGNLGIPLIDAVGTPAAQADGFVVVELSSFQLERLSHLRVHIAALLNISDDHLDRYASFQAYAAAKRNIFARQTSSDFAVVPDGVDVLGAGSDTVQARVASFAGGAGEVRVVQGCIIDETSGLSVPLERVQLTGQHNMDNACAAALMARLAGVPSACIEATLCSFAGLPHRMQPVTVVAGVQYLDDSKATNVGAAVASLAGFAASEGRVVLIAGGRDKGGAYGPLVDALGPVARAVVVIGESAPLLRTALQGADYPVEVATSMSEAVQVAAALAKPQDTVLLSPACSSFDMFRSFQDRGEQFQSAVRSLGRVS